MRVVCKWNVAIENGNWVVNDNPVHLLSIAGNIYVERNWLDYAHILSFLCHSNVMLLSGCYNTLSGWYGTFCILLSTANMQSRGDNTFGSVRPFVCLSVCAHRVFISRSIQNGWAFKMVAVSTGFAIAVDHPFNLLWVRITSKRLVGSVFQNISFCIDVISLILFHFISSKMPDNSIWTRAEYAKFVWALANILSGGPPVLCWTFWILPWHFTVKYAVNIKVFAGHFEVLDLHSPDKMFAEVKPLRWTFFKIRRTCLVNPANFAYSARVHACLPAALFKYTIY